MTATTTEELRHVLAVSSAMHQYTHQRLLGEVWHCPGLAPRGRSIVTLAALITRNPAGALPFYLDLALEHGVTPREISELIANLAFCAGWPNAMSVVPVTLGVFEHRPAARAA